MLISKLILALQEFLVRHVLFLSLKTYRLRLHIAALFLVQHPFHLSVTDAYIQQVHEEPPPLTDALTKILIRQ